ncbi:MAG: phosphate acyltransferase PlsX [Phycisphaerae bacterium]|jgi:glycerol-3-phosphate acyltransferase PlsX
MRVAVDAMGGDHAPREIIRGVKEGLAHLAPADQLLLYGPQDVLAAECAAVGLSDPRVQHVHCTQAIEMCESPVEALRQKKDSTIGRMAQAAGKGEVDAIISAGNTGAFVAASQLRIKPIPGISRPGIAVVVPTFHGPAIICDVGANVAPKPHHLHEYARMCAVFAKLILGIEETRIGLVSIGEEESKGNVLVKEARNLIKVDPTLNFVGNVEGRDIFAGTGNVFICDGFVGNVILKLTEGLAEGIFKTVRREIAEAAPDFVRQLEPVIANIWKKHDFAEYGGAPLLGINSVVIICHGRSDHRAIMNAIRVSIEFRKVDLIGVIARQMSKHGREDAA